MNVDWASFSPWPALAGGVLIGLAATLLALANGRVAGISGIVGDCFAHRCPMLSGVLHLSPDWLWLRSPT